MCQNSNLDCLEKVSALPQSVDEKSKAKCFLFGIGKLSKL